MNVFGYARVSTDMQAREGVSLGEQQHRIEGRAAQCGWTVNKMFAEEGVSGSTPLATRPQGAQLLSAAQRGDVVIATKLDRMFRDTRDALETIRWFKSRGIVLYLLDLGGQVTDDQVCYMLFTIVAAVAEFERERIAERTREAMAALRRNGKYTGGTAPFGWRWKDGELHEVAAEQVTIRRICELDDRGQGYAKIAGHLGLPPRKVKTILWRAKDPAGLAQYNARKKAAARRCKLTGQAPRPGTTPASTTKTFAAAIAAYAQSRGLPLDAHPARAVDRLNIRRLRRLIEALGDQPLAVISEEDLRALANRLYPSNPPATKNREVIGPAHAILHHAAAQGWIAKRTGTLLT